MLLHLLTPFKDGWRLTGKINSEKLDVASRGRVRKTKMGQLRRLTIREAHTIAVKAVVTAAESRQY
jgi:hypothetical protein